jgi:hypothetical protein
LWLRWAAARGGDATQQTTTSGSYYLPGVIDECARAHQLSSSPPLVSSSE